MVLVPPCSFGPACGPGPASLPWSQLHHLVWSHHSVSVPPDGMVPPHGPTRGPRPITVLIPPLSHGPMHDPSPITQSWSPMHRPCPITVLLAAPAPPGNPGPIVPAWSHLLRTKACRRRLLDAGMGDSSRRTFLPPFGFRQGQSCCFPPRGLLPATLRDRHPGQGWQFGHSQDRDLVKRTCLWLPPVSGGPKTPSQPPLRGLTWWSGHRGTRSIVPTGMSAQVGCAAIILPWKGLLQGQRGQTPLALGGSFLSGAQGMGGSPPPD